MKSLHFWPCAALLACAPAALALVEPPPLDNRPAALSQAWLAPDGQRAVVVFAANPLGPPTAASPVGLYDLRHFEADENFYKESHGPVSAAAFVGANKVLLAGEALALWDIPTGRKLLSLAADGRDIRALAVSPDGRFALSGHDGAFARLWDLRTGRQVRRLGTPRDSRVSSFITWRVEFLADGKHASAHYTDGLLLWELETGKQLPLPQPPEGQVLTALSPDGKLALSASTERRLLEKYPYVVWDVTNGKKLFGFDEPPLGGPARFTPDGALLTAGEEGSLCRRDAKRGKVLWRAKTTGKGWGTRAAFTPDGTRVILGDCAGTVELWDAANGKFLRLLAADRRGESGPAVLEALGALLKADRPAIRAVAAEDLGKLGPLAGKLLSAALKDDDAHVRIAAAAGLRRAEVEDRAALAVLRAEVRSQNPAIRLEAVSALRGFGNAAVPLFLEALRDSSPPVQRKAAELLVLGQLLNIDDNADPSVVPALREMLREEDHLLRAYVARSLWLLDKREETARQLVPILVEALRRDGRVEARRTAAELLQEIGSGRAGVLKAAVQALTEALGDRDNRVRLAAAGCLREAKVFPKGLVPALAEVLESPDAGERRWAARELGQLGPWAKAAIPALVGMLGRPDDSATAATALGEIGPDSLPAVLRVLEKGDYEARAAALSVVYQLGPKAKAAVPALVKALTDLRKPERDHGYFVVNTLQRIGPDAKPAVPGLIAIARNPKEQPALRVLAIQTLGSFGPAAAEALAALRELRKDAEVGHVVDEALGRIGAGSR